MPRFNICDTKFVEYNEQISDDIFLHKSKDIANPVKLNPCQVRQLFILLESIDEEANILWKELTSFDDKREHSLHIGWKYYLTVMVFRGLRYYDIRRWWMAPGRIEPTPTKTGIRLSQFEMNNLRDFQVRLFESMTAIRNIGPCNCYSDDLQYLMCSRCNPMWE